LFGNSILLSFVNLAAAVDEINDLLMIPIPDSSHSRLNRFTAGSQNNFVFRKRCSRLIRDGNRELSFPKKNTRRKNW
jgi:hypothetical protein